MFNIDSRPSGGIIFDFIAFHSVADRPSYVSRLRRESRPSNRPVNMAESFADDKSAINKSVTVQRMRCTISHFCISY